MKKFLAVTALAVASLAPLSTAKAVSVCGGSVNLAFCGSVVITTAPSGTGTLVSITVVNNSGLTAATNPLAVFTAIGLTDVSNIGTLTLFNVQAADGTHYTTNWQLETNKAIGGGEKIDILSSTQNGIQYGLSSWCSGAPTPNPIYTGGAGIGGPCPVNSVTFSFISSTANLTFGDVFLKAQGGGFSSECDFAYPSGTPLSCNTTTVPEPASIVLVGTGLIALGRRASRWRRRNQNA